MTSRKRSSDSQDIGADSTAHTKKTKVSAEERSTGKIDANGDRYWEISKMRRVTISSFRGKTMVNVREYYEKDGQELPGKKVSSALMLSPNSRPHGVGVRTTLMSIRAGDFYANGTIFCLYKAATRYRTGPGRTGRVTATARVFWSHRSIRQ